MRGVGVSFFFFFNDTATTEIYTLSLHDALPISGAAEGLRPARQRVRPGPHGLALLDRERPDRKSTRLNSSHSQISYAVFCLKKKRMSFHYCRSRPLEALVTACQFLLPRLPFVIF